MNAIAFLLLAGPPLQAPVPPQAPILTWPSPLPRPAGSKPYRGDLRTQASFIVDSADVIEKAWMKPGSKWAIGGGMEGIDGVEGRKYKLIPPGMEAKVGTIQVKNSFGHWQDGRALVRSYPDGTRFDEILLHQGKVFEHRVRQKENGKWKSFVAYKDESARPPGYAGLKQSCASCHEQAGTGLYDQGMVPGGDTVISDPLPWHLAGPRLRDRGRTLEVKELTKVAIPASSGPSGTPFPLPRDATFASGMLFPQLPQVRGRAACAT